MQTYFRAPVVEEGLSNIILQNRCGNRLTMLFLEESATVELTYKPNARRRKDYRARNFSNRDNFTTLFPSMSLPLVRHQDITRYDYDPFVTRFETRTPSMAHNMVTVVNIADHNAFALAARTPLLLAFKPRTTFETRDGLLMERFEDRGEQIVSFVAFPGFEQNRYRVLDDGTHVLQIVENDVVIIGGEETTTAALTTLSQIGGLSLSSLIDRNERLLAPSLTKGRLTVSDSHLQEVLDLNRRVVYSGMDEGGACFGALNRIYHLVWNRDGSMTTSLMARSGNPDFVRTFAPFMLRNPSMVRRDDGTVVPEFGQILGSRWSKTEDDGIFYAALALFTHFQTTGDDVLVQGPEFETVLEALDRFLDKAWEADRGLIGSDTRGESPLASNPYFGYDIVNGSIEHADSGEGGGKKHGARILSRCYSLYNNVNTFSVLTIARILLCQRPALDNGRSRRYLSIASALQRSLAGPFVDPRGVLYAEFSRYSDGSEEWTPYGRGVDYWEYAWACSLGPFHPVPALQLASARLVRDQWHTFTDYGFCPWNTLSRWLREHGMATPEYQAMLKDEIDDALITAPRFPMRGALGEYVACATDPAQLYRSWRALPFTAGSLFYTISSLALQNLPMGLALRASPLVDRVEQFQYRLSRIDVHAQGDGDALLSATVNGEPLVASLQIPERMLRAGVNRIEVTRGNAPRGSRLYRSSAELVDIARDGGAAVYRMYSPVPVQLVFENLDSATTVSIKCGANEVACSRELLPGTTLVMCSAEVSGDFVVRVG